MTLFGKNLRRFEPIFREGQCYEISHADVKPSSVYNETNHTFELQARKNTLIVPVRDIPSIPEAQLNFTKIENIRTTPNGTEINLLAAIKKNINFSLINLQQGGSTVKSELEIYDDSSKYIRCQIWGSYENMGDLSPNQVILIKNVVVEEYNNYKFLQFTKNSRIVTEVRDVAESKNLTEFISRGMNLHISELGSEVKTSEISEVIALSQSLLV